MKGAGGCFPTRTKTLRCRAVTQLDQGSQWVSDTGRPPPRTHCAFRDTAATEPLHKPSGKVPGVWAPCWGLLDPSGPTLPGRVGGEGAPAALGLSLASPRVTSRKGINHPVPQFPCRSFIQQICEEALPWARLRAAGMSQASLCPPSSPLLRERASLSRTPPADPSSPPTPGDCPFPQAAHEQGTQLSPVRDSGSPAR